MDLNKMVDFLTDHTASWSYNTIATLAKPVSQFREAHINSDPEPQSILNSESDFSSYSMRRWLSSDLIGFVVVSLIVGITINSLIPGRAAPPELIQSALFVFIYWIFGACIVHCFCKLMIGKGRFLETLNVCLQLSATLFVTTSFVTLILVSGSWVFSKIKYLKDTPILGEVISEDPTNTFFVVGTILSLVYLPLAMKPIHKFGWIRTSLIALVPCGTVVLSQSIYKKTGILMNTNSLMLV